MAAAVRLFADVIERVARYASIVLVLAVLSIMSAQIFFRYVLNSSLAWSEELSIWAMIWMVFIGSVVVMRNWEHIFIPTVMNLLPLRIRIGFILLSRVLVLMFLGFLVYYGWTVFDGAANAFSHNVGVSTKWAKLSIPLGAALMGLLVISQILLDLVDIRSRRFDRLEAFGRPGAP